MSEPEFFIGLMSGSSLDGIDAVLAEFEGDELSLRTACTLPFSESLRRELQLLSEPGTATGDVLQNFGRTDRAFGEAMADAVQELLRQAGISAEQVRAVGCHGHTVRHNTGGSPPFTLQLGDPNVVAERTGIDTVADFRRRDVAAGGQGAPLAPAFHTEMFSIPGRSRLVLNIGGIANLSILPPRDGAGELRGFDTGPGNLLLDLWCRRCWDEPFDRDGARAAQGQVHAGLLRELQTHPLLQSEPPRSTGREDFPASWLEQCIAASGDAPGEFDVQATLAEFTARCAVDAIGRYGAGAKELFVCGGGARNTDLMHRLQKGLGADDYQVETTDALGIAPEWVEALAWAWLARCRLQGRPGNVPGATGAAGSRLLGGVWRA